MRLRVNATRQELTRLKARLKMARRGHKLLKDKRDQLMKEFLAVVHENQRLRRDLERRLSLAYQSFSQARAWLSQPVLEEALMVSGGPEEIDTSYRHIMNVVVPVMELRRKDQDRSEGTGVMPYGLATTSSDLDDALREFRGILPLLVKLSEIERKIQLLADEIERTRRRVNALEYVLIPELEEAAKNVEMRLEEADRANTSRLMKVKDIVRAH
ncbi:MAG: V-type ATP synthase subunit D [Bacillota bacterium]